MTRDEIDALLNKAVANNATPLSSLNSLMPTMSTPTRQSAVHSLVPDLVAPTRPVYEEFKREEWDPTSEFRDTRGWKWSKNARAHDRFNEEQNALAAQHLQAYNAKLGAYQDELNAYNTAIERQREDAKEQRRQLENYFAAQGAIAPMGDDPSWQIRQLSTAWGNTTDAGLRNQYHQQALDLARKAGWIGEGEAPESVSLLPQVQTSMAGTPTYDRLYDEWKKQFEEQKYADDRSDAEFDRWYKMQTLIGRGSSGGGGGGRASTGTQSDRDAAGKADVYASLLPFLSDPSISIEEIEAQIYADAPGYAERKLKVEDMIDHAYLTRYGVDKKGYADWQQQNEQQSAYAAQFEADVAEYMRETGADRYAAENWVRNYYATGG